MSSRSKTVVIAKNLPYGTRSEELTTLFSPFGQLGRVILPPSGITALVEFNEPSVARKAFQKLAYTKVRYIIEKIAFLLTFCVHVHPRLSRTIWLLCDSVGHSQ